MPFETKWCIYSSLKFFYSIILKISSFSFTLLSVRTPFRKTSAILTYNDNLRKRFHLKDSTKTLEISSLLNTDLGNLNDSSLI